MKKLKKLTKVLILIAMFSISPNLVGADPTIGIYNGQGSSGSYGAGGTCDFSTGTEYCLYNNANHQTVKVSLYYYNNDANHSRTLISTTPVYLTNDKASASTNLGISVGNMIEYKAFTWASATDYFITYKDKDKKIVDQEDSKRKLEPFLNQMGVNLDSLTKPGEVGKYGYRIIIEPALTVYNNNNGNFYFLRTVKEIASNIEGLQDITCKERWDDTTSSCNSHNDHFSTALYTIQQDVGISPVTGATKDISLISDINTGYGYNIIDITDVIDKCYKVVQIKKPAKCDNNGKSNIGTFKETTEEVACSATQDRTKKPKDVTKNGRLTYSGNNCYIYCLEEAQQIFPGNYKHNVEIGYLVWPTGANKNEPYYNNYRLSFFGKRTCTIEGSNKEACKNVDRSQLYNFQTGIELIYNDGDTDETIDDKYINQTETLYKTEINGNKIIVTATTSYTLKGNYNRYISLKNGKAYSKIKKSIENSYRDIGYANLAISKNAKENEAYELKIVTTALGHSGSFSKAAKGDYICNYKIVKGGTCVCPDGTKKEGKILDYCVEENIFSKETTNTCLELQEKYCNEEKEEKDETDKYVCPPQPDPDNTCVVCESGPKKGLYLKNQDACDSTELVKNSDLCDSDSDDYYCDEPMANVSIKACVMAGGSIDNCKKKICSKKDVPHCPNTNKSTASDMDGKLLICVETKVGQGQKYKDAVEICEKLVCPLNKNSIIYRVIDLDNPFPGYKGKGRTPGINWNSEILIENKIKMNRKIKGNKVYNKEPLYTFILTPQMIKSIREYNINHSYDDFKLNCKLNNKSACISEFVHSEKSGLKSGTCVNVKKDNFYTCNK